jgi:DNA modification methylase
MEKFYNRSKSDIWTITTKSFKGAHFATYPPDLIEPCILAGCPKGGIVLDPFFGSGTTGYVALKNGRNYFGIELNPDYGELSYNRLNYNTIDLDEVEREKKQLELF